MRTELADYVLCLAECLDRTHHANDRPLYQVYLQDAGILLALAEKNATVESLAKKVREHERRWGQSWLAGPEYKTAAEAWERAKAAIGSSAGPSTDTPPPPAA